MSNNEVTRRVRELRRNQTDAERVLWGLLRNRRFHNLKFYRQKPFFFNGYKDQNYYIADFYCAEKMVIIELDGGRHRLHREYDQQRDMELAELKGIRVLRLRNSALNDPQSALKQIEMFVFGMP